MLIFEAKVTGINYDIISKNLPTTFKKYVTMWLHLVSYKQTTETTNTEVGEQIRFGDVGSLEFMYSISTSTLLLPGLK